MATEEEELEFECRRLDLESQRLDLERQKLEQKLELARQAAKSAKPKTKARSKDRQKAKRASNDRQKTKRASEDRQKAKGSSEAASRAKTDAPKSSLAPRESAPPPRSHLPLIALAVVTGLVVSVGVFMAVNGDGGEESLAVQSPAPRSPEGGSPDDESSSGSRLPPVDHAAMLERARQLKDRDPQAARRLLQTVEATASQPLSRAAADLLGELNSEQRRRRVAEKTAQGEREQAEWEGKAGERQAQAERKASIAAQVRLLDKVTNATAQAKVAKTPAELKALGALFDTALASEACDEEVHNAIDDAHVVLDAARTRLRATARADAESLAEAKTFDAALARLEDLAELHGGALPPDMAQLQQRLSEDRAAHLAALEREQEAAQAKATLGKAERDQATAQDSARRERLAAKITKAVTKRSKAWFKARKAKTLLCKECKGRLKVKCSKCKGREFIACKNCGGSGDVVTFGPTRGVTSKGGRRLRKTCPRCSGNRTEDCPKCTHGTNPCECTRSYRGALAGYRELATKRAFWEFVSPTGRRGRKKGALFPEISRGLLLAAQVGRTPGIHRASVESVAVLADHVVVTARVQWDLSKAQIEEGAPDEEVLKTVWIREKGKYYLRTPADETPEALLD